MQICTCGGAVRCSQEASVVPRQTRTVGRVRLAGERVKQSIRDGNRRSANVQVSDDGKDGTSGRTT